mgnify:CR=1 FL=1
MFFFFQAEDGIRDLVRSRGLGDVYKRQDEGQDEVLGRAPGRRILADARGWRRKAVRVQDVLSLIHI